MAFVRSYAKGIGEAHERRRAEKLAQTTTETMEHDT